MTGLPAPQERHWLLRTVFSRPREVIPAQLFMSVMFVCNASTPVVVGAALDDAVASQSVSRLGWWLGGLIALFAVNIVAGWTSRALFNRARLKIGHELRMAVTDRIQQRSDSEYAAGEMLSIASTDVQRVAEAVMVAVFPVAEATSIAYVAFMMGRISWPLGLAILVGGPLLVWTSLRVSGPLRRSSRTRQKSLARASRMATDVLEGLRIVKGLGAADVAGRRYDAVSRRAYADSVAANGARARLDAVTKTLGALYTTAVALGAGYLALQGVISVGELITIIGLTQFVIMPMTMMGKNIASRWATARASASRVRSYLLGDPAASAEDSAQGRSASSIPPGLTVVNGGEPGNVPGAIVVPHEAQLFSGTIADNVGGDAPATSLEVAAGDDIPGGLDREVGEGGGALSGGQQQRVALARAIAADPAVLVLQEPTTAVDSVTEHLIAERVARARGEKTTVVYTESPAWAAVANRVVKKGEQE